MLLINQNVFGIPTGRIGLTFSKTYLALDSIAVKRRIASRIVLAEKSSTGFYLGFLIWTYVKL
jgi:hypothetical protein